MKMRIGQRLLYHFLLWSSVITYLLSLNLPLLFVTKLYFFNDAISLLSILSALFQQHEFLLFLIIFVFVLVLPITKLTLLTLVIFNSRFMVTHNKLYILLENIGKWAMLDVFIVAVIIVMIKFSLSASASAQSGLYFFTYSIIASMICFQVLKKERSE